MTICLVTDRRGGGADSFAAASRWLMEQARAAVDAGVDLIQVRERDLDARELMAIVRGIVRVSRGTATKVVVNDRLDVALACGADGVHLRGDSLRAAAVRRLAPPGFLVGRSVHSAADVRSAGPVDYVVAGPVFSTPSKPEGHAVLGTAGLETLVNAAAVPVLAIGGMTVDRAGEVAAAGAKGLAAIGLFREVSGLAPRVRDLRSRFDSIRWAS